MFPTLTIGITEQNCCWWLACFSFIRMPPVRTSTRQAARRNRAPAARGSARGRPASRSGPRTSTTPRAADGAPDLAAQEAGTSSGSSRTSVATSSPPGPTNPGLIALLAEIQTSNQAMIQRLDALEGRTAQQGPQEAVNAAEPYRYIVPKPYSTSGYTGS